MVEKPQLSQLLRLSYTHSFGLYENEMCLHTRQTQWYKLNLSMQQKSKGGECFGYCDWRKYPKCDLNYSSAPKDVGNIQELGSCALTLKLAKHVTSLVFNCHLMSLVSLKQTTVVVEKKARLLFILKFYVHNKNHLVVSRS